MSCYSPVSIPSKLRDAKKGQKLLVPCGKCIGCLQDKQKDWIYRLECEQKLATHSCFVTFTYDEANIPLKVWDISGNEKYVTYAEFLRDNSIFDFVQSVYPRDFTLYMKRLRKSCPDVKFKYYTCFEYGDQFNRPHLHMALFHDGDPVVVERLISDTWSKGYVTIEPLIENRVSYVTKYILKGSVEAPPDERCDKPTMRCSKGLGSYGFLRDEKEYSLYTAIPLRSVQLHNGVKIGIPRYLRRKFFYNDDYLTKDFDLDYEKRKIKESKRIERYDQDRKIATGKSDLEATISAYVQNYDGSRVKSYSDKIRKRRKGM